MTSSHAPEIQFNHRFKTQSPRVGFVASYFNRIGGTESFHKLLLPHIPNLVGFAYEMGDGNPADLGVPAQGGTEAIRKLCQACDVIVTWGVSKLPELIPPKRPRIVNVHHGSIYSPWSNEVLESIMPVADKVVTVCPLVLQHQLALGRDTVCIPNAIDPRRTASARKISKSKIRRQFDIPSDMKFALWCHRNSAVDWFQRWLLV